MTKIGDSVEINVLIQKKRNKRLGIYIQYHSRYVSKIVSKDVESSSSLFVGDLITKVDGKTMSTKKMALAILKSSPSVTLTIIRNEFYSPLIEI